MTSIIQFMVYFVLLVLLAGPLGFYIYRVMNYEDIKWLKWLKPLENGVYKMLKVQQTDVMLWKDYAKSVFLFSLVGFVFLFTLQLIQGWLLGNPQNVPNMSWHLSFNNASSFVTNTNWQSYSGEASASYLLQMLGLTVQNFVSAATGIAVLFAVIRGICTVQGKYIGNYWVDMVKIHLYILLPLSMFLTIGLVSQGVVQNLKMAETATLVEPIAIDENGVQIAGAEINVTTQEVLVAGEKIEHAQILSEQFIPMGPAASQIAIKQLGTNGGGFFGVNSAHPFENPTILTNLMEVIAILLIPVALCFTFGRAVNDRKQGYVLFSVMLIVLVLATAIIGINEYNATPQIAQDGHVDISTVDQAGGNMEGKEARFGIVGSSIWIAFTTAASNGSVNAMHDSLTPLGGAIPIILMQLGEVIFGGVGSGLYGMLCFVILTVFIAGLMVGRTPEYLGKKIEPYEMKWAVIGALATPVAILISAGISSLVPAVLNSIQETGPHGFSEFLYTFTSAGANNGSAFAGFSANTPYINVVLGLTMLFARFVPIISVLAIAGSLVEKKKVAMSSGTLQTNNGTFGVLLLFVVLLVGVLSFLPALALGPIAEYFSMVL